MPRLTSFGRWVINHPARCPPADWPMTGTLTTPTAPKAAAFALTQSSAASTSAAKRPAAAVYPKQRGDIRRADILLEDAHLERTAADLAVVDALHVRHVVLPDRLDTHRQLRGARQAPLGAGIRRVRQRVRLEPKRRPGRGIAQEGVGGSGECFAAESIEVLGLETDRCLTARVRIIRSDPGRPGIDRSTD